MNKRCLACFKTVSNESRAKIYEFVQSGKSKTVSAVVAHFKLTQPTVSYHLTELAKTGLLKRVKKGREVFYDAQCTCGCGDDECPVAN